MQIGMKSKNEIVVTPPVLIDLGKRPEPNSPDTAEFSKSMRAQTTSLSKWWLDQMVASENQLHEKMVWFCMDIGQRQLEKLITRFRCTTRI